MIEQDLAVSEGGLHARGSTVCRGASLMKNAFPEDPTVGLFLGAYGGPRWGAFSYQRGTSCIDHKARPRKHRLGAIRAVGALLNIVRQPRTIGDPERDQPHDGHGPPPGAGRESESEREREREREIE